MEMTIKISILKDYKVKQIDERTSIFRSSSKNMYYKM